jgi:integrase
MALEELMYWQRGPKRWFKKYKQKTYAVSPRQLGCEPTKEASREAANEWWRRKQAEVDDAPPSPEDQAISAFRLMCFMEDFEAADPETRLRVAESILGKARIEDLKAQVDKILGPVQADRTIKAQVEGWGKVLRASVATGQMDISRCDAYLRNVGVFRDYLGAEAAIDVIDASKLEGFYADLALRVQAKKYSPAYAHSIMTATKQFVSRLAELGLIPLPGNIRSHRFTFGGTVAKKIEVFTIEEVRELLKACDGFSERTELYLLLMLNCGMYQSDISDLGEDEIDWQAGTLTRPRSKTPDSQRVTYKLWPRTLALLKKYKAKVALPNERGSSRVLLTERGEQLVRFWEEEGKMRRYDIIQSAYTRLQERVKVRKPLKCLRKTSASLLAEDSRYKFYCQYFLAQSPRTVADKSYVIPSESEFFEALDWLRRRIMGE